MTKAQSALTTALLGGKTLQEVLDESAKQLADLGRYGPRRVIKETRIGGMITSNLYPNSGFPERR